MAYRLKYPNKEVQLSFETDLATVYIGKSISEINTFASALQKSAYVGDVEEMVNILKSVFASVPYGIQVRNEKYYQSILYLTFKMCGMNFSSSEKNIDDYIVQNN